MMITGKVQPLLLTLLCCLLQFVATAELFGQVYAAERVVIPIEEDEDPFFLLTCEREGIILYRHVRNGGSATEKQWEVRLLDHTLRNSWHTFASIPYTQTIIGGYYEDGFVYFLVLDYAKMSKRYLVIRMDIADQSMDYFELGDYVPENLDFLRVHHGSIILGGTDKNKPSMVCYRYGNRMPVVLEGIYGRQNSILGIEVSEAGGFIVYVGTPTPGKGRTISINHYSESGELQNKIVLQPGTDRRLLDCKIGSEIDYEGPLMCVGVYASSKSNMANGIYTVVIGPTGAQEFKYYGFENLRNFFRYLPPSDREKVRTRIQNRKERGRSGVHSEYIMLRPPEKWRNQSVMVGECYIRNNKVYDPYYGWESGYIYSHAFYVGIKPDGRVIWDNSMAIQETAEVSELQKTLLHSANGEILAFSYDDPNLYYKRVGMAVQADTAYAEPVQIPLFEEPAAFSDIVIRKWYGDHYLLFGKRTVEPGSTDEFQYVIQHVATEDIR